MRRLRDQAIQAFRPLLSQEEGVSNRLVMETFILNRRWEWVAVLIGIAFWIPIEQSAGWWWGRGTFLAERVSDGHFPVVVWSIGLADVRYIDRHVAPLSA